MVEQSKNPSEGSVVSDPSISVASIISYNQRVFIWNEKKRQANLVKHGLDFKDAANVYNHPQKVTRRSNRQESNAMPTSRSSKSSTFVSPSSTRNEAKTSASSPSATLPEKSVASLSAPGSLTDWEYVRRMANSDEPIPYDPEDGPYDPNDDAAVEAYWAEGECLGLVTRGLTPPSNIKDRKLSS